jgi:hypothetical protein
MFRLVHLHVQGAAPTEEGILADIRPASVSQTDGMHEILVLESEADEAHTIICGQMMK